MELELVQKPPVLPEQIAVKAADGHQSLAEGARADFLFISAMHQVIRELPFGNVLQRLGGVIPGKIPDLPKILLLGGGHQAFPLFFELMERLPNLDLGSPCELIHAMKQPFRAYEDLLDFIKLAGNYRRVATLR